jgi:hypothetical protein
MLVNVWGWIARSKTRRKADAREDRHVEALNELVDELARRRLVQFALAVIRPEHAVVVKVERLAASAANRAGRSGGGAGVHRNGRRRRWRERQPLKAGRDGREVVRIHRSDPEDWRAERRETGPSTGSAQRSPLRRIVGIAS